MKGQFYYSPGQSYLGASDLVSMMGVEILYLLMCRHWDSVRVCELFCRLNLVISG